MTDRTHNTLPSEESFFRKLWELAVPISLQSMMFSLLGLIDLMMVSHLGEIAVAAVGFGNRIFFFNMILIASLSGALSILAAQYIGAGQFEGVRRSLAQTLIAATGITFVLVVFYMLFPSSVVSLAGNDSELLSLSRAYLLITAPSFICTAVVIPLETLLRANNDAKSPTRIGLMTILLNILLNYVFIFGAFGIPGMGVAGSALGTVVSRFFQMVVLVYFIQSTHRALLPTPLDIARAKLKKHWKKFFSISIPMIFQDGLWSFGVVLYNIIYASLGVNELAVMSAISSVEAILISLFIGFAIAASIMLGKDLGANQFNKAWKESWHFMLTAPVAALVIALTLFIFRDQVVSVFSQFNTETLGMASQIIIIAGFALCIRVINLTGIVGVLRSGGDVKATAYINITGMWLVGLPLAWVSANVWHWPLYLVFMCALMEEVAKAILVIYRILSRRWLNNLVDPAIAEQSA